MTYIIYSATPSVGDFAVSLFNGYSSVFAGIFSSYFDQRLYHLKTWIPLIISRQNRLTHFSLCFSFLLDFDPFFHDYFRHSFIRLFSFRVYLPIYPVHRMLSYLFLYDDKYHQIQLHYQIKISYLILQLGSKIHIIKIHFFCLKSTKLNSVAK